MRRQRTGGPARGTEAGGGGLAGTFQGLTEACGESAVEEGRGRMDVIDQPLGLLIKRVTFVLSSINTPSQRAGSPLQLRPRGPERRTGANVGQACGLSARAFPTSPHSLLPRLVQGPSWAALWFY